MCLCRDHCSQNRVAKGICALSDFSTVGLTVPQWGQYFSDDPYLAGSDAAVDYCPVKVPYGNGDCTDIGNYQSWNAVYGNIYGQSSRCFDSSLLRPNYGYTPGKTADTLDGQCFARTCIEGPAGPGGTKTFVAVEFNVLTDDAGTEVTLRCDAGEVGTRKTVAGMQGVVECPSVDQICWGYPCENGGVWKNHRCVRTLGFIGSRCTIPDRADLRLTTPSHYHYEPSQITLLAGNYHELTPSVQGSPASFSAVTQLPLGMTIDPATGVIKGVPSSALPCTPFTLSAAKGIEEARALVFLAVVSDSSAKPTSVWSDCAAWSEGTQGTAAPTPAPADAAPTSHPQPSVTTTPGNNGGGGNTSGGGGSVTQAPGGTGGAPGGGDGGDDTSGGDVGDDPDNAAVGRWGVGGWAVLVGVLAVLAAMYAG
ncbi:unnamed protein product [Vitrella brassicaformis CCMP3155]|uniref:Uncharacterized protein n=2 Tax=Vitrella brassicaformis TaxID=1169539 RepID=A0A0G4EFP2_VITBC|nr:unnamed protein product [Vitrella brassicaformis CCMP3155]|eukprot:CEL95330.1 unnamed protein product [Vitrella brassicaformis CCMP3155]